MHAGHVGKLGTRQKTAGTEVTREGRPEKQIKEKERVKMGVEPWAKMEKPEAKGTAKRDGIPKDFQAFATIADNPATVQNGALLAKEARAVK